ncbi:MAG: hypothetical protein EGS44_05025 [Akkermansia muciniphila]|nr:hypothetical protein [Akkermansia muciniphila]
MAAAILRFEDSRVTGPTSLRVSRLPAADKGGKWEICGICDGIEPAVFNRLKALLDAGKREEAWEGCLQYVLDNTAAVRAWIGSDAHPGIEFFLRDHYFNSGSKNTGKILQRVLDKHHSGLTVDGIIGPMSKAFLHNSLSRGNDVAFLDDLREQRAAFYRSCKQFPTFGKGWLRRCDDAFSFARSLA